MNPSRTKNLTLLWLLALFLNAFSFGIFASVPNAPAEMVYCPLAKRFQPIKASPQKEVRKSPLDDICADKETKNSFLHEFFSSRNLPAVNRLNDREFENLVFDFSRIGRTAFQNLPPPTDFPRRSLVKNFSAAAGFGKTDEPKFIWKLTDANFSFAGNSRPPTNISPNFFEPQNLPELEKISRRIAPRAPPFFL